MSILKKAGRSLFHAFLIFAAGLILGINLISQKFSPSFSRFLDSFSTLSELRAANQPAGQSFKSQNYAQPVKDYATDDQEDIDTLLKHRKDYMNVSKRILTAGQAPEDNSDSRNDSKKSQLVHLQRIERPSGETVQLIRPRVQQIIQQTDDSSAGVAARIREETMRGQIDYRENYQRNLASEVERLKVENNRLRRQIYESTQNRNIVLRKRNQ